jgi:hypothetical protein
MRLVNGMIFLLVSKLACLYVAMVEIEADWMGGGV